MEENILATILSLGVIILCWMALMISGLLHSVLEKKHYRIINGIIIFGSGSGFLFTFLLFVDPGFLHLHNMNLLPGSYIPVD